MAERAWRFEWPTWLALAAAYGLWGWATTGVAGWSLPLAIVLAGVAAAFHSSLSHEALHGHPTENAFINAALVFPALSLFIPYLRFCDLHLAHHDDARLTDPDADPESNFLDPARWARLPGWQKTLLRANNTLLGRMILGPVLSQISFMRGDWRAIRAGDRRVLAGWLWHVPAVALVVWWAIAVGRMPGWAYLVSAWLALSLLKIRTFLEHRAHVDAPARTVLIESRGPLALLFLNNSFHIVHHSHPRAAWYLMPGFFRADRAYYRALNGGYVYRSYAQIFRAYLLRAKDPVAHPLWPLTKK